MSSIIDFDDYALIDHIFRLFTLCGVHIPWTGLRAAIPPSLLASTPGFSQNLEHESNQLVFPVSLIVRVINVLRKDVRLKDQFFFQCGSLPISGSFVSRR